MSRWREKYDRMKRWQARLEGYPPVDGTLVDSYYAFFECCYHLKDWLKADASLEASLQAEVEPHIDSGLWLRLCADIANGSKHLVRNSTGRIDVSARVTVAEGAFAGSFQPDAFQTQDQVLVMADGPVWDEPRAWDAIDVVRGCVEMWPSVPMMMRH